MTLTRRSGLRLLGGAATAALLGPVLACGSRRLSSAGDGSRPRRVALLQYRASLPLQLTRDAFVASLAARGFPEGPRLQLVRRDAGGSQRRCRRLAAELVAARPDLLVALGTPSLMAAIAEAPSSLPIVFCYCSNPWAAGAGQSAHQHRHNVTGTVSTNPVDQQLQLARTLLPVAIPATDARSAPSHTNVEPASAEVLAGNLSPGTTIFSAAIFLVQYCAGRSEPLKRLGASPGRRAY